MTLLGKCFVVKPFSFSTNRLAESCSHVGAVLFAVAAGVSLQGSTTCTMEKSQWLMPSHVKKVCKSCLLLFHFSYDTFHS